MTLPQKGKKGPVTSEHVRPYLIHTDGTVVTVQGRAWMDSAGICMWADVQIGPMYARKRGKALIVWDNCGSHNVDAVQSVLEEWGLNMTDILQPMDLVVNGPIKAGIRRARVEALFNYFQQWKIERLQHLASSSSSPPPFAPPKPCQSQGILMLDSAT